jgi:hypothetical protein
MTMGKGANIQGRLSLWVFFAAGILFSISLIAVVRYVPFTSALTFWFVALAALTAGAIIACLPYSSIALLLEMTTIGLMWLVFKGEGYGNSVFCYLPLVSAVLISVSYPVMTILSPMALLSHIFNHTVVLPKMHKFGIV